MVRCIRAKAIRRQIRIYWMAMCHFVRSITLANRWEATLIYVQDRKRVRPSEITPTPTTRRTHQWPCTRTVARVESLSASLPPAVWPIALIVLEMLIYHIHQNFATLVDYWLPISIHGRWTLSPWKNPRPSNNRTPANRRLLQVHFFASDTTFRCDS